LSVDTQGKRFEIALEMKRTNEGLHGVLTAIGQSDPCRQIRTVKLGRF